MENKSLAEKAIDIKGKQYVLVQDRVLYFNEKYPEGSIITSANYDVILKAWIVKATVYPNTATPAGFDRSFNGYSQAVVGDGYINKTSALENAETSAVGRALAFMGIGVIESIASADEMNKALGGSQTVKTAPQRKERTEAEQRELAAKDRIVAQLKRLGKPYNGKQAVSQSVFDLLGVDLVPDQYESIGEELSKITK